MKNVQHKNKSIVALKKQLALGLLILIVILLLSWSGLEKLKNQFERDLRDEITTVLEVAHAAIDMWVQDRIEDVDFFSKSRALIHLSKEVVRQSKKPDSREYNSAIGALQDYFDPHFSSHNGVDFFLLSRKGVILASSQDDVVGELSPLMQHGSFIKNVFAESPSIILPYELDVQESFNDNSSYLYIGASLETGIGDPLALVFQIDPSQELTRLLNMARFGDTGNTYVFNEDGRVLLGCRFDEQLISLRLIKEGATSSGLVLHDPGGNLLEGYIPSKKIDDLPLTYMAQQAIGGGQSYDISGYRDYRGVPVLGAWTWDKKFNLGVVFEIDRAEAYRSYGYTKRTIVSIFSVIIILFLGYVFTLVRQNRAILRLARETDNSNKFLRAAQKEAIVYRNKLQATMSKQIIIEEKERRRIANELHDTVAQMLSVATIKQQKLQASLTSEEDIQYSQEIIDILSSVLGDIRLLTFELSLLASFRNDLSAAIEALGRKIFSQVDIDFSFHSHGQQKKTCNEICSILCRIVRELFYNIIKHAEAKHVVVEIQWKEAELVLAIIDDGRGFDEQGALSSDPSQESFGLLFIQERLDYLRGTFRIETSPALGTKICIGMPLQSEPEELVQ